MMGVKKLEQHIKYIEEEFKDKGIDPYDVEAKVNTKHDLLIYRTARLMAFKEAAWGEGRL